MENNNFKPFPFEQLKQKKEPEKTEVTILDNLDGGTIRHDVSPLSGWYSQDRQTPFELVRCARPKNHFSTQRRRGKPEGRRERRMGGSPPGE
jgi:hypothetical protein